MELVVGWGPARADRILESCALWVATPIQSRPLYPRGSFVLIDGGAIGKSVEKSRTMATQTGKILCK